MSSITVQLRDNSLSALRLQTHGTGIRPFWTGIRFFFQSTLWIWNEPARADPSRRNNEEQRELETPCGTAGPTHPRTRFRRGPAWIISFCREPSGRSTPSGSLRLRWARGPTPFLEIAEEFLDAWRAIACFFFAYTDKRVEVEL